jgi:putative Mn2+ efflux pump MntP
LSWLSLLGVAVALAMDAFAVSIAAGLNLAPVGRRHTFRLAFHFGLFQFLMPVLGWLAGRQLMVYISALDHWVALGLLGAVGGKMLWDARREEEEAPARADPSRGWMLVTLSVATSIDALAVGLSIGLLDAPIWIPAVVIGLVAGTLSAVGVRFGSRIGRRGGRIAEAAGGCVLILIGIQILVSHLAG